MSRTKMSEQRGRSETDRDDPIYYPGSLRTRLRGRPKEDEDPDLEKIPSHLIEGYRILQHIMRVYKFFQQDPNLKDKGMYDYYEVIKQPICFDNIKRKFVNKEYTQLCEFVNDVRLLLLNCYRFFGPKTIQTERALFVEELLEKRLALLSEEQRELCSLQATHGKLENVAENAPALPGSHFESKLLKSVEKEKSFRIMERKEKLSIELQRQTEGKEKELLLWERQTLFTQSDHEMMKYMWEIPVIGHFISLAIHQLNIQRISMYEIERMFLMPQASKSLGRLMTTLLNSPLTRLKIHTQPSMAYKLWCKKLALKVSGWYKIYVKSNNDPQIVFEKLGIEHQFWKIFGNINPLEKHEFHELTFHQRVFLVKTLCDYILQNHKLIRDTIAEMTKEFGTCLGTDRTGAKYIYFPQFLNLDIRIYKQNLDPKTWVDRDVDHEAEMCKAKSEKKKRDSKLNRKRSKRRQTWKFGKIKKRVSHYQKVSKRKEKMIKQVISLNLQGEAEDIKDGETLNIHTNLSNGDNGESLNSQSSTGDKGLETGEVKLKTNLDDENIVDNQMKVEMDLSGSVFEDEQLNRIKDNVTTTESEPTNGEHHEKVKLVSVKSKNEYKMKNCDELKTESSMESIIMEEQNEKHTLYCATWLEPDPEDFVLLADSVEGVRELSNKFCDDDVALIQRLNNSKKGKSNRPICEVNLAHRLVTLIEDLETLELKLVMERNKVRAKLYEEWKDFINRPADFVDPVEAFGLSEKEPIEIHDGEVQGIATEMQPDVPRLEGADLPQTPDVESLQIPDRDSLDALAGGMTLRHRRIENLPSKELKVFFSSDIEKQSAEDEDDNWEIPKNRKRKRTKHLKCIPSNQSSKKKGTVQKQNQAFEVSAKITNPEDPDIQIVDYIKKSPAKKLVTSDTLWVKKHIFFQSQVNCQLKWEKNRQKLVNMVSGESTRDLKTTSPKTKIIMDSSNKLLLDNSSIIGVQSTDSNQALTNLQGRKLDDVIRQRKVVRRKAVIKGVIGMEMDNSKSLAQTSGSLQPLSAGGQSIEQINVLNISDNSKSCVNVGVVQASHTADTNRVTSTESLNSSQPSTNIIKSYSLNEERVFTASMPPQNITQIEEVVILSDESDNDIEFIDVVYNPKLDKNLATKHKPHTKTLLQEDRRMGKSHSSRRQSSINLELSVRQGEGNSSCASGQQTLIDLTSPQYYKNTYAVKHSSPIQSNNQKQASTSVISTLKIRMGNSTESLNSSQPSTNIIKSYSLNEERVFTASMPPQNITQIEEVVILSDESDNDIEFIDVVYNPKLDRNLATKHKPHTKTLLQEDRRMGKSHSSRRQSSINLELSVRQGEGNSTCASGQQTLIDLTSPQYYKNTYAVKHSSPIQSNNQKQASTSVISTPKIRMGNSQRNNVFTPQNSHSSTSLSTLMYQTDRVSEVSARSSVCQPGNSVIRGNMKISPRSAVPQPRTPGFSMAVRRNMIISPGSGIPQSRTAGYSNVFRGNTIISSKSGVHQPRTPGYIDVVRENTIISPVSGVLQPETPGYTTGVRENMVSPVVSSNNLTSGNIIPPQNPGIPVCSPVMSSSNTIRGNTVIFPVSNTPHSAYRQVNPYSTPIKLPRATVQRPVSYLDAGNTSTVPVPHIGRVDLGSDMQLLNHLQHHGLNLTVCKYSSQTKLTSVRQEGSALQRLVTQSTHSAVNSSINSDLKTTARLVVVPGDESTGSNYGLIFPNGNRFILSPKQVSDIRAANGGYLPTNVGW